MPERDIEPLNDSAYEQCFACRGTGVELGMEGDIATCYVCHGACVIRRRDSRGRFVRA